jgi:predicted nucleic acid-binding protein
MARGLIADTSGIIALLDRDDCHHQAAVEAIKGQIIINLWLIKYKQRY